MSERDQTHKKAVEAVVRFIRTRGFAIDDTHFRLHGEIHVTSHERERLHVPSVNLKVHGATQPPDCAILAGDMAPAEDIIVFCWLSAPPEAQFLFLTKQEATSGWLTGGKMTEGWHRWPPNGSRAFYGNNDNPPKPENASIWKILKVGVP